MIYPLRLTEGVLFIDNSSKSLIDECLRKGALGLALQKKQARDETALRFGGIMHKVLEARYEKGPDVQACTERDMIAAAQAGFLDWEPDPSDFRNLDQAVACLQEYNKTYPMETFEILEVNGHAGTETPFAVPFAEIHIGRSLWVQDINDEEPVRIHIETLPVVFTGRIDLVIKQFGGPWLMDHKTSSIGGAGFFSPFYIDAQFKGYCWALKTLMGLDKYPAGVKINGLINRRPTRTGKSIEFLRDDITFTPCMIDEWKQSFIDTLHIYIDCLVHQSFPMQTAACVSKYGKCEFYDVCSLPLAQREIMLESGNYVDRTWNPITQENDKPKQVYMP